MKRAHSLTSKTRTTLTGVAVTLILAARAGLFLSATALYASGDLAARMLDLKATVAQRNDACFALRGNRSPAAIAALRTALADSVVRTCAAQDLRQAGASNILLDALDADDPDTQAVAARELGEMRDPSALQALGHAALDSNVLVASAAIDALAAYGEGAALPLLLQAARQPGLAGVAALERAAAFHNTAVLPLARQVLSAADAATKVIALGVIGDLGDESDLSKLREIAAKPDPVASRGRGFGFMPVIDLARVAQNAMDRINARIAGR